MVQKFKKQLFCLSIALCATAFGKASVEEGRWEPFSRRDYTKYRKFISATPIESPNGVEPRIQWFKNPRYYLNNEWLQIDGNGTAVYFLCVAMGYSHGGEGVIYDGAMTDAERVELFHIDFAPKHHYFGFGHSDLIAVNRETRGRNGYYGIVSTFLCEQ